VTITTRAALEVVIVAIASGFIGVHIILRRLPFLAVALAHGSFPGIIVAGWIGVAPLAGALGLSWLLVLLLLVTGQLKVIDQNAGIGVLLAGSLGIGALLQSLQARPVVSLASLLTGNLLGTTISDLIISAAVGCIVAIFLTFTHKELIFGAFDPEAAAALGYSRRLDALLLLAVASVVVVTLPALGAVLSIAMLTVPAMTARLWSDRITPTVAIAIAVGLVAGLGGLQISRMYDVAAGGAIALAAASAYFVSWFVAPHGRRAG
jgi:ABC-type Mn2+/Zn2+ transport system permease subunit